MALIVNQPCQGFMVKKKTYIDEIHSWGYLLEHIKSGAKCLYLANNDDNKVFSISFRTPPSDDSGIPHILEHSSLCGSRKYRLKEPFVDLVKGSLNTFLNAMTYPDKTMYPVASRNAKDFRNLMDVYLDAVFFPLIYENKYTLRQEGWHYNIDNPEGELSYNGVVYNEMKGVYSSADAFLENEAMKALFPESPYRFESGGYPDAIPELTQEKFEDFHKTYYSPENAYIFIYGDMDGEGTLAFIDREYLNKFERTGKVVSEIPIQAPLARTKDVEAYYPVAKDEDIKNKTYHELNIVTGVATDVLTTMALRLLENVLLESESSPLRRALMDAGIGQNVSGSFSGAMLQPVFSIRAAGSEPELKDKFISTIYKTLQKITVRGLDKNLVKAALNSCEFRLKEADFGSYPKGLLYGIAAMDTWLYGGDPLESFRYEKYIKQLRVGLKTRYYENLIEHYLLDTTHKALVTLIPKPGMEEEHHAAEIEKMAALKASMSQEELVKYAEECAELHRLQAEPDSEEAREAIPLLKRQDIRRKVECFALQKEEYFGNQLLFYPAATNGIVYLNFNFDISGVSVEQLPLCFLLTDVLGKFNTRRYSYEDIATYSIKYTGGVSFDVRAYSEAEDADKYRLYFQVKAKALLENLPRLFSILSAVGLDSQFTDLERFRELVNELDTDLQSSFFSRGQTIALARLFSYCSDAARVNEQDQFSYQLFIKDLVANFDAKAPAILEALQELLGIFFQKSKFMLGYACDAQNLQPAKEQIVAFLDSLPYCEDFAIKKVPLGKINEAIAAAGKVQYVAAGGNFAKHGYKFKGSMRVLETILRYEYLWTRIRIQGGAYGAIAMFQLNGLAGFASYRDPQLLKSLEAFKDMPQWLAEFECTDRELDKYVIGTISTMDTPLTNSMALDRAVVHYLKGITDGRRQVIRDEVLDVTVQDIRDIAPVVEAMLKDGYICVVGGEQAIEENKDLFTEVLHA